MNPDDYTIREAFLEVGNGHELYIHEWGNPKAKTPIISLHGGPGSGCKDKHKLVFDPKRHRVIFFDQRGSGRSLPYGSLKNNTTADLVEDIEKIAKHLKLDKFILQGNSWGSSLSLFYALKYPKRVKALVISGVWTCSKDEIAWLDQGRMRTMFPDAWDAYLGRTPKAHQADPSAYHFKRALGADAVAARESAYAYGCLEGGAISLDDRFTPENIDDFDPTGMIIEIHYLVNGCFMPNRYILDNAHKLTMPVWIVQSRYDMVCPPITAYELSKKLPHSELIWTIGGHRIEHESWNVIRTTLAQITEGK